MLSNELPASCIQYTIEWKVTVNKKVLSRDTEEDVALTPRAYWPTTLKGKFPSATTGGNASQITDGAAALVLMKRSRAQELGQPIVAKFCGATISGLEPRIMGIGPSLAIPKILSKFNLSKDDIDIFEINEAFSSMVSSCGPSSFCYSNMFVTGCLLCQQVGLGRVQG